MRLHTSVYNALRSAKYFTEKKIALRPTFYEHHKMSSHLSLHGLVHRCCLNFPSCVCINDTGLLCHSSKNRQIHFFFNTLWKSLSYSKFHADVVSEFRTKSFAVKVEFSATFTIEASGNALRDPCAGTNPQKLSSKSSRVSHGHDRRMMELKVCDVWISFSWAIACFFLHTNFPLRVYPFSLLQKAMLLCDRASGDMLERARMYGVSFSSIL